ncbi:hypothetical protein NONI108955_43485 [Nocardia ninae]
MQHVTGRCCGAGSFGYSLEPLQLPVSAPGQIIGPAV